MNNKPGTLYLIPTFLGVADKGLVPPAYLQIIHQLDEFIVENEKPARAFLKSIEIPTPLSEITLHPMHKHITPMEKIGYLNKCEAGKNMGLLSDAGLPCIADPGFEFVRLAHQKGITVYPLHGLSSITMALMASGFNGQMFRFHGYLPHDKIAKKKLVNQIISDSKRGETQIFIETPYRNSVIIAELKALCPPETRLCVAVDLSLPQQLVMQMTLKEFPSDLEFLQKRPAVFLIGT